LLVEHLRVVAVVLQRRVQVVDRELELIHIEVALRSVFQELDLVRFCSDCFVEIVDGFVEVSEGVVAASKAVVDSWVLVQVDCPVEVLDCFAR